ncbi:Major facilitator superfamily protein [Spironucleus salmonicida]|uniref:Major facilitator superfamily protein n=1 Tax=Spironucleus salmonicida TaxID=348837 RepID=V6LG23_9EUKA|nr:Major facilitator superfamily protein [Spironucleus salmonicida]|eukprot:EST43505.1 Major facilitator superfamily protein [Spironucleus salmonicida]
MADADYDGTVTQEVVERDPNLDWPTWKILMINLTMCGVGFCFSVYCVINQPYLEQLNLGPSTSSIVQVLGPVFGFFVQPVVGYLTDRSRSKYGARKLYVTIGCVLTALSQLWCGFAQKAAATMYTEDLTAGSKYLGFVQGWAIVGIVLFNIAVNVEMGSFHSLIAVNVPKESQGKGASGQALMGGISNTISNVIMLVLYLTSPIDTTPGVPPNTHVMSWVKLYPIMAPIACVVTLVSFIPAFILVKETQLVEAKASSNVFKELYIEFRGMNKIFYFAMIVLFVDWLTFTPNQQFLGKIFSVDVTNMCAIAQNVVVMIFSPFLAGLVKKFGERNMQFFAAGTNVLAMCILFAGAFPGGAAVNHMAVQIFCQAIIGFLNACMNSIHLIIVGVLAPQKSKGLYAGIFNCTIVVAQAVDSAIISGVSALVGNSASLYVSFVTSILLVLVSPLIVKRTDREVSMDDRVAAQKEEPEIRTSNPLD